jgi:hypothetical protein
MARELPSDVDPRETLNYDGMDRFDYRVVHHRNGVTVRLRYGRQVYTEVCNSCGVTIQWFHWVRCPEGVEETQARFFRRRNPVCCTCLAALHYEGELDRRARAMHKGLDEWMDVHGCGVNNIGRAWKPPLKNGGLH